MHPITIDFKKHTDKAVESLREDLKTIRTGRATPALVENLQVTTYGGSATMKLREIATITTEGPSMLVIIPFDTSVQTDIEKSILASNMGLSPSTQGARILIKIPPLSEEQRQKYVRMASQMIEEKKVSIRGNRDDARRKIKLQLDQKIITEDDKFRLEKEVDDITGRANETIQTIKENKEKEIMQV